MIVETVSAERQQKTIYIMYVITTLLCNVVGKAFSKVAAVHDDDIIFRGKVLPRNDDENDKFNDSEGHEGGLQVISPSLCCDNSERCRLAEYKFERVQK